MKGFGAQVSDTGLNCNAPIWPDDKQSIVSDRAADETTRRHTDTAHLSPTAFRPGSPLFPSELFGAPIEWFFQKSTRGMPACPVSHRSHRCFTFRTIDSPDIDLIQPELPRRFGNDCFHDHDALHSSRGTLGAAWWSVRKNRCTAPAHGKRLIQQGHNRSRSIRVTDGIVRSVVADHEHIECGNASVLGETDFHPSLKAGPRPSNEVFLLTADAHHHGRIRFLGQQCRNNREDVTRGLAAETSSGVLADENNLVLIHIQPAP